GHPALQLLQFLGEALQPLVIGVIVAGEALVLGDDLVRELVQLALDRGDALLCGTQLCAVQTGRRGPGRTLLRPARVVSRAAARSLPLGPTGSLRPAQLQILLYAAGHVPQPATKDRELLVGDPFEQVAVVADHDQGAWPGIQLIL